MPCDVNINERDMTDQDKTKNIEWREILHYPEDVNMTIYVGFWIHGRFSTNLETKTGFHGKTIQKKKKNTFSVVYSRDLSFFVLYCNSKQLVLSVKFNKINKQITALAIDTIIMISFTSLSYVIVNKQNIKFWSIN